MSSTTVWIIVLAAALLFVLGVGGWALFHIWHRERNLLDRQERRMVLYPRPRLSVGSDCDVPRPNEGLRKRPYLPYEAPPDDYSAVRLEKASRGTLTKRLEKGLKPDAAATKRRRSLRGPLLAPKPRRQKKSDNAIPLQRMTLSPLSAITERSNGEGSPKAGLAELPTSVTPKDAANLQSQDGSSNPSQAWPLPELGTKINNLIPEEPTGRNGGLVRTNSAGYNLFPRPSMRRSISLGSQMTAAPEENLPPLPMIYPLDPIDLSRKNSRLSRRFSILSIDTTNSGTSGNGQSAPATMFATYRPRKTSTASINLNASGLYGYDRPRRPDPTPLTLGSSAGRQVYKVSDRSIPTAKSYHGSIRLPITPTSNPQPGPLLPVKDSKLNLQSTTYSPVSRPSPSIPSPIYAPEGFKSNQHHLVDAQHPAHGKLSLTRSAQIDIPNDLGSPIRRSTRRASIASSNPLQFDQHYVSIGMPIGSEDLSTSRRKGHKRQHCVQISDIPSPIPDPLFQNSPPGRQYRRSDDGDDYRPHIRESIIKIPGLSLLDEYNPPPNTSPLRALSTRNRLSQSLEEHVRGLHTRESVKKIPGLGLLDNDSPSQSKPRSEVLGHSIFDDRPDFDPSTAVTTHGKPATVTSRASSPESSVFDSPSPVHPTSQSSFAKPHRPLHQPVPESPTPTTFTTITTASLVSEASDSPVLPAPLASSSDLFTSYALIPFRDQARPRGPRPAPPARSRSPIQKSPNPNRRSVIVTAQMLRRMDSTATVSDDAYLNFTSHRRSNSPPPPLPANSAATIAAATSVPSPTSSPVLRIPSTLTIHPAFNRPKRDTVLSPFVRATTSANDVNGTSRTPSVTSVWDDVSVRGESLLPAQTDNENSQRQSEEWKISLENRDQENIREQEENIENDKKRKRKGIVDGPRVDVQTPDDENVEPQPAEEKRSSTASEMPEGLGLGLELPKGFEFGADWGALMGE